jgi:hypothetical protein
MQRYLTIAIAVTCALSANAALAQELQPVTVRDMRITDCTPPTSYAVCDAWHAQIRSNFNKREIGMLFGARTAYAEYRTSFASVEERYNKLLISFAASNHVPVESIAAR